MNTQNNTENNTLLNFQKYIEDEPTVRPVIDLLESKEEFQMKVYMPGVKKENIVTKLDENLLTIFGKVEYQILETMNYVIRERGMANYYRVFELSEKIDSLKIKAKLDDGILTITLPKSEKAKPKEIIIN
jgi:HSP20 family protein